MDAGTIIYIVLVLLYFIFTAFKKKDKPVEDERFEGEEQGQRRPASFEDMLREIRQEQEGRIKDLEETGQGDVLEKPRTFQDTYEEERTIEEPKPLPQKPKPAKKPHRKYYEGAEGSLKSFEKMPLKTLDEQVDIYSDEKILGEVEDVAEERVGSNRFAELLKNQDTVKDAVVLSEILNRRHF